MLDTSQAPSARRGFRVRRPAAVLPMLALALGIATAAAPAASAATARPSAASATVGSIATGQTAASRLGGTAVRSATTDPATTSMAKPAFAGFCVTAWSGRFISTNCYGVGLWRQYADCSASGFTYTSPWLVEPPIGSWIGACPAGQYVISANVQF